MADAAEALLLAIETSGPTGSVAVGRGGTCRAERELPRESGRHARTLVSEISEVLAAAGVEARDVDCVAVGIGPGSFTGLRVGVVAAKTFAWSVGCELVAVDTFDVVAAAVPEGIGRFVVFDDAQRGDVFARFYDRSVRPATTNVETAEKSISVERASAWFDALKADDVVVGPGAIRFADRLSGRCRLIAAEWNPARAGGVLPLALERLRAGLVEDVFALEPRYLRRSSAEVKWDRDRGATGA